MYAKFSQVKVELSLSLKHKTAPNTELLKFISTIKNYITDVNFAFIFTKKNIKI